MDKISVIIPVYNGSEYIYKCLNSIVQQDYSKLEIIIVNDGSTDDSVKICEQFRQNDSRIKIINQKNQGTAIAKNVGLSIASGQFIYFIDVDDWLPSGKTFSTLYNLLKSSHSEIAVGDLDMFDNKANQYLLYFHNDKQQVFTPKEWFKFQYKKSQRFSTPWGKLFKHSLFKHICFPKYSIAEDDFTMWKLYLMSSKIAYINQALYVYRQNRSDSITSRASLSESFSLEPIEERIAVESLLNNFDNITKNVELDALRYRLNMHKYALNIANHIDYKHYSQITKIINKY